MEYIIILVLIIVLVIVFGKTPFTVKKQWQHYFDNHQFSTVEFYKLVENGINERQMPAVDIEQETFHQTHVFSDLRAYLKVTHGEYIFYICCAPFGTGTFVSWWLCLKDETWVNKIWLVSKLMGKDRNKKSFYQMDTEAMYKGMIHSVVQESIDKITNTQGVRGMSELQRHYVA